MRKGVILLAVALVALLSVVSANMAPLIHDLEQEILVCESSPFSLKFSVAELDGDSLTIGISPSGPFFVRSISSEPPLTEIELFSSNLTKIFSDKTYEHTVFVSDGERIDSRKIIITVLETNNPPEIGHLSVETLDLNARNKLRKQIQVTDKESGTPQQGGFSFEVSDPANLLGLTVDEFGMINYTAAEPHIGVHDVSVCVTDPGVDNIEGKIGFCAQDGFLSTSCKKFQLAVTEENSPPTILALNSSSPTNSRIPGTQRLTFQIFKYDPEGLHPDTYWYVDNKLKEIDVGKSSDTFIYSFGCGNWGRHKIKAVISDGMFNDSVEWIYETVNVACLEGVVARESIGEAACEEKWGCLDWGLCQNAVQSRESGNLDVLAYQDIKQRCDARSWDETSCGYQVRSCSDLNNCNSIAKKPLEVIPCRFSLEPSCSDGVKNCHEGECEFLTDCGGPCQSCPTCSDGIKNQGEEEPDCGGPCPEQCSVQEETTNEGGTFLKQSMLIAIVVALILAAVQVFRIIRNKNRLEEPPKRELVMTYE
ncbi:MAG: hypothetical protein ABH864_03320 [archaeon]